MGVVLDEIVETLSRNNVSTQKIDDESYEILIQRICEKFCNDGYHYPLWDKIKDKLSFRSAEGWKYAGDIAGNKKTILFLEKDDEPHAFIFKNGDDIKNIRRLLWLRFLYHERRIGIFNLF